MDLLEKEKARLAKQRLRQKRYTERAKAPHPVPVHMTWEMRERLDYLVAVNKTPGGISGFMREAFEFYAAHLLGTAPPAEVAKPAEIPDPPPVEPPPPVEALEAPAVEVTPVDPPGELLEKPEETPPVVEALEISTEPEATEEPEENPFFLGGKLPKAPEGMTPEPDTLPEPRTGRGMWAAPKVKARSRKEKVAKTLLDAEKRVPVRIEFTRQHHHIPWGMRHIMWDNGLQHRGNVWRGRLHPDYAETLREQVAKFGGTLEVTGGLGEAPKWAPGEYRKETKKKAVVQS
jgi:hypothetical protein